MPQLTDAKHEAFARSIASGARVGQAYLEQWPNVTKKSASEAGSRLAKKVNVVARIGEIRQLAAKAAQKAEGMAVEIAAKRLSQKLLSMQDRRSIMSEIALNSDDEDRRMKAAMNDARLAGELIDKADLTSDGEALPTAMPTIELKMPETFLRRRGTSRN